MGFIGKQEISVYRLATLMVVRQEGIGLSSSSDDMFGWSEGRVEYMRWIPGPFLFYRRLHSWDPDLSSQRIKLQRHERIGP